MGWKHFWILYILLHWCSRFFYCYWILINSILICWAKYTTSNAIRYFPITYTVQPVLVTGYNQVWGGGNVIFNWLNGMSYSDLSVAGFIDHSYNGGGGLNHYIAIGY